MTYEHPAGKVSEHDLHNHELHDQHSEHAHEGHVCSATCEHHQAVQHIDFMEPVERHDHEDHDHVHGPNCGHMEYQHVHTEIDKPHVHDEHCGHLDHHKAAEHVDYGKDHKHDEPADHPHEENHIHGPNCGHMEYEKAHKHVDEYADESPAAETVGGHAAGDAEVFGDTPIEGTVRQAEQVASVQQQTATKAAAESKAVSAQAVSNEAGVVSEIKAAAPAISEVSKASAIGEAMIMQLPGQAAVEADNIPASIELTSSANEETEQVSSIEEQPVELLDVDTVAHANELETMDLSAEPNGTSQMEMPLTFSDTEPGLELVPATLTDSAPGAGSEILDSLDEPGATTFDFNEGLSLGTDMGFETLEEAPSLQLVEEPAIESLADIPMGEGLTHQDVGSAADFAATEQQIDFSNFGNGQIPEVYNVEWPVSAEISGDELESRLDTTRRHIARFMEQGDEIDPSDLETMSDQLIAMLRNLPKESIEELLPLLEELTELYELPQLERLLELYFAGHYQDRSLFTQLFGSTAQDTQDITARIGHIVLKLLNGSKHVQNSA